MIKYTLAALALSAAPAIAQQNCAASDEMWEALKSYGEVRHSVGMSPDGQSMAETWGNSESGTWTILITSAQGVSCIAAFGVGFYVERVVEGESV